MWFTRRIQVHLQKQVDKMLDDSRKTLEKIVIETKSQPQEIVEKLEQLERRFENLAEDCLAQLKRANTRERRAKALVDRVEGEGSDVQSDDEQLDTQPIETHVPTMTRLEEADALIRQSGGMPV